MNFLAHHIISIFPENYYYNLGLTFPDILIMQNKKCKINERIVDQKLLELLKENDNDILSFFKGMKIHLQLDKWFHNNSLFYTLLRKGSEIIPDQVLPVHQFVEILFDIYLDKKDKQFAKSLIETYKDKRLDLILEKIKNFWEIEEENFDKLRNYISNGIFYETYLNDESLFELLKKLSLKINRKIKIDEKDNIKVIITKAKSYLESDFDDLFDKLKIYSNEIQKKLE